MKAKAVELAELVTIEKNGRDGLPRELSFSEIESIGHGIGKLVKNVVGTTIQE